MANVIAIFMLGAIVSWIAFGVISQLTSLTRLRRELEQRVALVTLEKENLMRRCNALSREYDAQAQRHTELSRFVNRLAASGFFADHGLDAAGRLTDKERDLLDMAGKRVQEIVETAYRKSYDALFEADRALQSEARQVLRRHASPGALVEPSGTQVVDLTAPEVTPL